MKDVVKISVLMDLYEGLLTVKQKSILKMYIYEDYSLNEISEVTGVTRQAAHDAIKKGIRQLEKYERILGIAKQSEVYKKQLSNIKDILSKNGINIVDREIDDLISGL